MSILLRFLLLIFAFDLGNSARLVKRKESYYHVPPAPSPPTAHPPSNVDHNSPPYQFEEVNPDEFPTLTPPPKPPQYHHQNHHNSHQTPSKRFENDLIGLYSNAATSGNYLIDNGLRSIAKGSADQALGAVASQAAAGKQAAYVAKSTLAQAASQAASTAVAALKGKEVLLQRLEEQIIETHKSMEAELAQLQQAKRSAKAAQYSAQQAINHVSILTAALNNAQSASELAQKSAAEAATELASQIDMVAQANAKLEQIESRLYAARLDYEETKEAAEKATHSAQEAQLNANDAAVHANVELGDSTGHGRGVQDKSDQVIPEASSVQETKREAPNRNRNRRLNRTPKNSSK